jgi:outer membrane protein, adhesin transport system
MRRRSQPALPCRRAPRAAAVAWAAALLAPMLAWPALAACVDEDRFDLGNGQAAAGAAAVEPADPRAALQAMVRDAQERSQSVGAARLLAEAAEQDTEEARAAKKPYAALNVGVGPAAAVLRSTTEATPIQLRGNLNLSQIFYDGGRTDRLVDWRGQLAEAARYGQQSVQEQLALNTVSLAFERSRYRMHALVYRQYVRKMSCLVQALEQIVAADKGRLSELVQAQKSLKQAELSVVQAASQARQVEVRLRRLVGDGLPSAEGLASLLIQVPELPTLLAESERSSEISQLLAQSKAMNEYARALEAGNKPQLSWTIGGGATGNFGGNLIGPAAGALTAGVTITVPLLSPGIDASVDAARKRAQAAALQRSDAIDNRKARINESHEQALLAFDRVRRVGDVLRDSERVRSFTLQQWQQLGKRSLFDVMGAEGDHYSLRIAHVDALHDGQQMNAILLSLGPGVSSWLR